jgi:hypothetical protein
MEDHLSVHSAFVRRRGALDGFAQAVWEPNNELVLCLHLQSPSIMAQSHARRWLKATIASTDILWLKAFMTERTPQDQDKYVVRFPEGMRERLKDIAGSSGRSLNAEIIARLAYSLEGNMSDLSAEGFGALMLRFEATVEAAERFVFDVRDINPGLEGYMIEHGKDRKAAIHAILRDWLTGNGYLKD